jgi:glutathione-regulated potassium-efflux system ancillary protein KefC/glutathione-regulated potassium-efflux system protein KefB
MNTLLHSLAALLLAAVIAVPLFRRLGLGSVLGYLAAGIVIGPAMLGLFTDPDTLLHISEFGVVLLLFIIGLELQPSRLWVLRRSLLGEGGAQVVITALILSMIAAWWIDGLATIFVIGSALALSSTAFVLQMLAERKELTQHHGRSSFSILLFQDLAVIPLLAMLPLLAGKDNSSFRDLAIEGATVVALFAVIVVAGRFILRHGLRLVNSTGLREVSTAAALLVVVGISVLMEQLGLSMALGAFTAGVLLADSEYRHQLEADIEPFKGLLLGLFFMSVGMGANLDLLFTQPGVVLLLAFGLLAVKAVILYGIGRINGMTNPQALRLALILSQGGEFAFLLFATADSLALIDTLVIELLVLVVTISMVATPLLYGIYTRWVAPRLESAPEREFDRIDDSATPVVIAGFGRFGQMTGRLLRTLDIPYTALDINPEQVDVVRRFGNRVHFGDAARTDLLEAAKVGKAKVFVLAIDDAEASLKIVRHLKQHYPQLKILARARNRKHAHLLMDANVDWLIRETQLSAMAMAEQVLESIGMPAREARRMIEKFREHDDVSLKRQHAVHRDNKQFMQSAQEAANELRGLFEGDRVAVSKLRNHQDDEQE